LAWAGRDRRLPCARPQRGRFDRQRRRDGARRHGCGLCFRSFRGKSW
jgi:hypothetical protein